MTVTDPMVLPQDVVIVPVGELPPAIREELEDGDYAVTRRRARAATTIVDAHAAVLLERFRSPTSIVNAVIAFSRAQAVPPADVLEEAFPMFQKLLDARIMVPAGTPDSDVIEPTLAPGDVVGAFTVRECVQVLDDIELYRASGGSGDVALKVLRPTAPAAAAAALEHEAAVLRHLEGAPVPRLLADESAGQVRHIVLAWIDGIELTRAAAECRRLPPLARAHALRALCRSVLHAYADLHARGVVHGDVHPRNVLVDAAHTVTLIDFGLARVQRSDAIGEPPGRGGVGFFYEPEFARSERSGERPPPATYAGEQYALGALLYLVLTGFHYTDFSLEREELARQIETAPPEPFVRRGLEPWPDVERALVRALGKEADERFGSVVELAAALDAATVPEWLRAPVNARRSAPAQSLLDEVLERLLPAPARAVDQPLGAPTCSINYGAAGRAYALYRLAQLRDDPALLAAADVWAERAARDRGTPAAFVNEEFEITPDIVGPVSPYHSLAGVRMAQALIAAARADGTAHQVALDEFVSCSNLPCQGIDLTLGRSGTLVAGALLLQSASTHVDLADGQQSALLALGRTTVDAVWAQLDGTAVGAAGGPEFLGIAHGWAGILYATILWCRTAGDPLPAPAHERLGELAARESRSGGRWPLSEGAGEASAMPGWCHGSAGYTQLWALAADALGDARYGEMALRAAHRAADGGDGIGSLCCGLAGRAYAALTAYRQSGEREWVRRALELADAAANGLAYWASPQGSLYKGDLGVALLAAERECPERTAMPVFEPA